MLRHGNKRPDSLMLRAEVPQISVAKAVVRHWSCFLYHSLLVQRDFQTQKGKALPSRLQLTKKHHAGTCSLPLAVHSGVVEANEQSPFISPLWLSSLYETLTAGRKIQLAEVFSSFHCPVCMPVVVNMWTKRNTGLLTTKTTVFEACQLGHSPQHCHKCQLLYADMMRPATILSYSAISCTCRWSRGLLPSTYPLFFIVTDRCLQPCFQGV